MRGRPFFVLTLHVRKTGKCHREAWMAGWQFPIVTRQEQNLRGRPISFLMLHVGKTGRGKQGEKCHTDHPERPQRGWNSVVPNRFGIDVPWRAVWRGRIPKRGKKSSFWDGPAFQGLLRGVNPKTILNNCHHRQAQAAALRNLPLRSIPSLATAFTPGLSDICRSPRRFTQCLRATHSHGHGRPWVSRGHSLPPASPWPFVVCLLPLSLPTSVVRYSLM